MTAQDCVLLGRQRTPPFVVCLLDWKSFLGSHKTTLRLPHPGIKWTTPSFRVLPGRLL